MSRCLYCYNEIENGHDFHKSCTKSFFGTNEAPIVPYDLNEMDELAKQVVERSITVPGVQPKLSMSLVQEGLKRDTRLTVVGALGGNYIFKPPNEDYSELPQNEHLTMRIAEAFGLKVVPSSLIRLKSGELGYITKRIDRTADGQKIHMLDMFQILEAFDKYKGSYEKIGKAIGQYSANTNLDKINYLELLLFCFLTGNTDMHLKNFSLIDGAMGWTLSPAYDLLNVALVLPEDKEEMALSITGKKSKLKRKHFENLGKELGLTDKQISGVFNRLAKKKPLLGEWIQKSFLSVSMKEAYLEISSKRIGIVLG